MSEEGARQGGHRRSERILALEERARAIKLQKKTKKIDNVASASTSTAPPAQPPAKKRGRKRKSLQDVEGQILRQEDGSASASSRMPSKQTLEFILDVLQRRDKQEIFAQPVDPDEVLGYYNIIKEPMDFGTMRAKLQEGMYTNLEQFERDVFLITSNAMKFNSSTSVFYTEARIINDMALRLFHSLRTEPENFQLEYSRTRRRCKKPQDEAGCSNTKTGGRRRGVRLGEPLRKRRKYSHLNLSQKSTEGASASGSRDGGFFDVNARRNSYMHQSSVFSENESLFSTEFNAPKLLNPVSYSGIGYVESLANFVKNLGPTAKKVANKKLARLFSEPPSTLSWTPLSHSNTSNFLAPAPPSFQRPRSSGITIGENRMLHNPILRPPSSYKGKEVDTSDGINVFNAFVGERHPVYTGSQGERTQVASVGPNSSIFLGESNDRGTRNMEVASSSREKTVASNENMDLLLATLMHTNTMQNRNINNSTGASQATSSLDSLDSLFAKGKGLSISSSTELVQQNPTACSFGLANFSPFRENCPLSTSMDNIGRWHNSFNSFVERSGSAPSTSLDHRYGIRSIQTAQPVEWNQSSWNLQSMGDLPNTQAHTIQRIPPRQNSSTDFLQVTPARERPLFDATSFLEGANQQGHQAGTNNADSFWNSRSFRTNNKDPDLNLQL